MAAGPSARAEEIEWGSGLSATTASRPSGSTPDPTPPLVDYTAVLYTLRQLPAEQLIRLAWAGTGQADRAVAIARRESGLNCAADNPRSSAAGLFQTLSIHRPRAERLGFTWAEVAGPDCLADVMLAFDMWRDSGWRPWAL